MSDSDPFAAADAGLQAKTGKSLAQWVEIARSSGVTGHMAQVEHLKSVHGLGHGHANTVVHSANASAAVSMDGDELVEAMFAGPKAALRPIYDRLVAAARGFGAVELAPKKGYVSARRAKQFAILQPSTKDRFDLGLNLKGVAPAGRLEAAGSWNAMCTHRVRLADAAEADAEVTGWLREAWERAA